MKRLCALILALMLLLSVTALASVTPSVDKTTVSAGDTVKVAVNLDAPIENVYGFDYRVYFNDELFDYVNAESVAGDAISGVQVSPNALTDNGSKYVKIQYYDTEGTGKTVNAGTLYTIAFKAKTDISEDSSAGFELKKKYALDSSSTPITGETVEVPEDKAKLNVAVQPKSNDPLLKLSSATGEQGKEVTLELSVENNPGIIATMVELSYDSDKLELVKVEDKKVLTGYITSEYVTANPYKIGWDGTSATADYVDDAVLAICTFKIKEDAEPGETDVKLEFKTKFYDFNLDTVEFEIQNGKITITEPPVVSVESVTLDKTTAEMKLGGETLSLTATVNPENATDKTIVWTSDNEDVATVADGVVTAVGVGSAKITATAGEKSTSCVVKVKRSASKGYTVELLEDQSINFGDNANVRIQVGVGEDDTRTTYNAVDMELNYDSEKLSYTGETKIGDVVIDDDGQGTLKLVRYGSNVNVGETLVTLKFTAKDSGEAKVKFVSAKVDESANAIDKDAPDATMIYDNVVITIGGYKVNLGDDFTGDAITTPGSDYTFTGKDTDHYNYSEVKATINGDEVDVTDNGDGSYTIKAEDITGDITITGTKTGKKYAVTITGEDTTGANEAQYGVDYTFNINKESGHTYTIDANVAYTDNGDGSYTIAGNVITKPITIDVTKTKDGGENPPTPSTETDITITGVTAEEVVGGLSQKATNGQDFTLTLNKDAAYDYEVKAGETEINANDDGTYTIPGSMLDGTPLTVTITKTIAKPNVEVVEYLKLKEAEGEASGKSMWLVLATGKPVEGNVYSFNGNAMFTSEKYEGAYCYLMISEKTIDEVKTEAAALIDQKAGTAEAVSYNGDVNKTSLTDINDAQLVYDMYQAKYVDFETLTVENFLRADMDGSKNITVKDAATIVASVHTEFQVDAG